MVDCDDCNAMQQVPERNDCTEYKYEIDEPETGRDRSYNEPEGPYKEDELPVPTWYWYPQSRWSGTGMCGAKKTQAGRRMGIVFAKTREKVHALKVGAKGNGQVDTSSTLLGLSL